jgi:hypothetical protein
MNASDILSKIRTCHFMSMGNDMINVMIDESFLITEQLLIDLWNYRIIVLYLSNKQLVMQFVR